MCPVIFGNKIIVDANCTNALIIYYMWRTLTYAVILIKICRSWLYLSVTKCSHSASVHYINGAFV